MTTKQIAGNGNDNMIADKISKVQEAVSQFGFSAVIASNDLIVVRNGKGQDCAHVTANGVEQKFAGAKNLCGALVRNAINRAL
jgi:hypothetical protein